MSFDDKLRARGRELEKKEAENPSHSAFALSIQPLFIRKRWDGLVFPKLFWPSLKKVIEKKIIEIRIWRLEQFTKTVTGQNNFGYRIIIPGGFSDPMY